MTAMVTVNAAATPITFATLTTFFSTLRCVSGSVAVVAVVATARQVVPAGLGIGCVVSVHLYTDSNTVGTLNMYSVKQRHYTQAEMDPAKLIGAHAPVALAHFRGEQHLWKAIDSRHRIGIAHGILLTKYQLDANQALAFLSRLSQTHTIKLHLLAGHIVQHRQPPDLAVSATPAV